MFVMCLDWLTYEVGSVLVGLLHDPVALASHVAVGNIATITYMIYYAFNTTCCNLVGKEMGAGNVAQARRTAVQVTALGTCVGLVASAGLYFNRARLAIFYSEGRGGSGGVVECIEQIIFIYVCYVTVDALSCMLFGVLEGLGLQRKAVRVVLMSNYCIMVPLAAVLCLFTELGVLGVWIGYAVNSIAQTMFLAKIILNTDWLRIAVLMPSPSPPVPLYAKSRQLSG
jgi:MATE family multidrug resistance protein